MLKAFKYRIMPSEAQKVLLDKHIGACRFLFNLALETKQMTYAGSKVNVSCFDLIKQIPDLKKECDWLKEINSQSLQQSIVNLDVAFTKFFKGQSNFPNFKKKGNGGSFSVPQNIELNGSLLSIPKFKKGIKVVLSRPIKGEIRQATISRNATGKYFVSILCETGEAVKAPVVIKESTTLGLDLGIKTFIVASEGTSYDNPRFLKKSMSRLMFKQRKYSKKKGKKARYAVARLHEKVANQRKDFLQKLSSKLIKNHDTLALETLKVSNMIKNHNLAGSIADAGWSTFVSMLEYKANWYGKNILRIGAFEPSSKICNCCGKINRELKLQDREWTCSGCKSVLDRDLNAAINIKNFALKNHLSTEHRLKNQNELPTLVGVLTSESHSL